ncbi:hypothetical protein TYRP_005435 [Tyrophagus putrescentiae]|nr:hypothetical protein TYRP_005435 [Tyrophagus putrescentiae]
MLKLTAALPAFRLKNTRQEEQVRPLKFQPIARSPQTRQILSGRPSIWFEVNSDLEQGASVLSNRNDSVTLAHSNRLGRIAVGDLSVAEVEAEAVRRKADTVAVLSLQVDQLGALLYAKVARLQ